MTIGHVAITTTDMEASLAFYERALGIAKAFSLANPADGTPWIEYLKVAPGQFIELFYGGTPASAPAGAGFSHLCLAVEDIHVAARQVEAAGYALDARPGQGADGNWQCWVRDPDGVRIELMQVDPSSPQASPRTQA